MIVLAIDPGPKESAAVLYDAGGETPIVQLFLGANRTLRQQLTRVGGVWPNLLAIEQVGHYGRGMPAGRDVFDTCVEIGRFLEAWDSWCDEDAVRLILRPTIKTHLCGTPRAKDGNVRQALLDYPRWQGLPMGGGATPVVGTRSKPGPLYGIKSHLWSALAVAVVAAEMEAA